MREARAFADHELAARAWYYLSPFPAERALAARRFRELADLADADHLLQIVGELALEGYHAKAISAAVVRDRVALIPNEAMAAKVAEIVARVMRARRTKVL